MRSISSDGSSTLYIGGIYEKREDGSYVKYYWALGRRIAMRVHSGPGDPEGVVRYLLADHLGSSTQIIDSDGTLLESVKYYPYGSAREGGMTGTDKQFTGQQEEGTAFGLYNYGARFYSAKLGRFLSADPLVVSPGDPQMLDRYAYVRNNPLKYVDPSGLHAVFVGGTGQNVEVDIGPFGILSLPDPRTIESYKLFVQAYWLNYEGVPAEALEGKWSLFSAYVALGASPEQQLAAGAVAFLSTAQDWPHDPFHGGYIDKLANLVRGHHEVDTLIGFSLGGHVAAHFLASGNTGNVTRALLIEPAFHPLLGGTPIGKATDARGVRILTWNGYNPTAAAGVNCYGDIPGALNMTTGDCGGHCSHGNNPLGVLFAMHVIGLPYGWEGDRAALSMANDLGIDLALVTTRDVTMAMR